MRHGRWIIRVCPNSACDTHGWVLDIDTGHVEDLHLADQPLST